MAAVRMIGEHKRCRRNADLPRTRLETAPAKRRPQPQW
jgi:hypothetical protein